MAKVAKQFFCIKTQKTYKVGSEYKGKRKDLDHLMEGYKEPEDK
jgi:hypothetical protein